VVRGKHAWSIVVLAGVSVVAGCRARDANGRSGGVLPAGSPVRIVVGYAAGGGYDLGARLVARHLGRHLPGMPSVIVENMPGAGGLVATKYLATVASPDGLTLGLLASNSFASFGTASPDAGQSAFTLLGSPAPVLPVCAFTRRSGITTWAAWKGAPTPPRMGTAGPGSISHVITRVLERVGGVPVRLVAGYAGSAEARMALANDELDGFCATWETLEPSVTQTGDLVPVVRVADEPVPGFDTLPDVMSLIADEHARRLLSVGVYATNALGRVYVAPPNTPAAVVDVLRTALAQTLADPVLAADAAAAGIVLAPLSGADIEAALERITSDPASVEELQAVLTTK